MFPSNSLAVFSAAYFFTVLCIQYLETICLPENVRQKLIEKTLEYLPVFYISAVIIFSIDSMF